MKKSIYYRVEQLLDKNQFIIYSKDQIIFQSYDSVIAVKTAGQKLKLGCDWDYSKTTLKHLYLYIERFIPEMWRKICDVRNKRAMIQRLIETGEIKFINNLR